MLICFLRSILIYFFVVLVIRLLGKRQLGEMEPSEFVVSLLVADIAAAPMQDQEQELMFSVIPILTILALELLLSALSYHYITVRKLFCGKPTILMEEGKILHDNLRKTRVTPDELTEHLREKGIIDLSTVKYAILETNGQISALIDPSYQPPVARDLGVEPEPMSLPVTIICNGRLLKDNLELSGKSEAWLDHIIQSRQCKISQVLLLTVDSMDNIYISTQV